MKMETEEKKMKYVLVTGGVVSGLGKGVTASSIGVLLKACGLNVTAIKIDPDLNTDAGTMSPFEQGEVFDLDDGGEVDLDLGNNERFLDFKLNRVQDNNITTGKIDQHVMNKERKGDYLGKTVQVVPHVTDAIQEWIERMAMVPVDGLAGPADVCVIEMGGTIGGIGSMPFIEALRRFSYHVGHDNFCLIHVSSLVPILSAVGEQPQKRKLTLDSVRELRSLGLKPDILACCSTTALDENVKKKISQFAHVLVENTINLYDVPNIWHIPLLLRDQKAHEAVLKALNLKGVANSAEFDLNTQTLRALFTPEGSTTHMGGTKDCKSAKLLENGGINNQQEKKDLEDGGTNNQQERKDSNGTIALVVAIFGIFFRGIDPSIFETKHCFVVAILVVVLIYAVTSTVLSQLKTKSTMFTIVSDIELFSQLLFVPLFIFMLVPLLGLISLVLWTFSLPIWIVTRYFPEHLSDRLVWLPAGRSLLTANSEGQLPR